MNKAPLIITTEKQKRASNPYTHSWVCASAGSGKTYVLVQRILRLLLRSDVNPENITAITYTKAGANEMSNRIINDLNKWAVCEESELQQILTSIIGEKPTQKQTNRARSLFARVLDSKGGLKVQTIHSFCQSLLAKFPLESGVSQSFSVVEDITLYIQKAKQELIKNKDVLELIRKYSVQASNNVDDLFKSLSNSINIVKFSEIKADEQKIQLKNWFNNIEESKCDENWLIAELDSSFIRDIITKSRKLCDKYKENESIIKFKKSIDSYQNKKESEILQNCFLNKDLTLKKTNNFFKENQELFSSICDIYNKHNKHIILKKLLSSTNNIYDLSNHFIKKYNDIKQRHNVLDFNDIIHKTKSLLENENIANWILFKTDYGHKHVLLDEAQDTSPSQWEIIRSIIAPFFDGTNNAEDNSLFVVGDEKQSIYSFQGAYRDGFINTRNDIENITKNASVDFTNEKFDLSFRTSLPVLQWVDNAFIANNDGVSDNEINHFSNRENELGMVKLLPALKSLKGEEITTAHCYAKVIAEEIISIIGTQYLPSTGDFARAGDIIVLVRKRNDFPNALIRELKNRNVPVEGADRVILNEQIVVQDLLSLLRFGVFPNDDLNLACLLKSPIFGFDDEKLFSIANTRGKKSLWQSLQGFSQHATTTNYLNDILNKIDYIRPLELINYILNNYCPISDVMNIDKNINVRQAFHTRLGKICNDFINALLIEIQNFELQNPPTVQGFLNYFDSSKREIKREQDARQNRVRIMTVYASKGLEAPIVIIPCCMDKIKFKDGIVWGKNNNMLFIDKNSKQLTEVKNYLFNGEKDFKTDDFEESKRLLYVAMTRAKDVLICGGFGQKGDKNKEELWYNLLFRGINKFDNLQKREFIPISNNEIWNNNKNIYLLGEDDKPYEFIYTNFNVKNIKIDNKIKNKKQETNKVISYVDWVYDNAPNETDKYAKLNPSQSIQYSPPAIPSPLIKKDDYDGLQIGIIIHKCLEFIPDIDAENRESAIANYLYLPHIKLNSVDKDKILAKILNIINDYPYLFDKNSKAELPLSGVVKIDNEKRLVSGFIDRLCFVDDEIWIVDYKSNINPPSNQKQVPLVYIRQLEIYKQIIEQIYLDKKIKTKLLWTYNLDLMDIVIK